MENEWNLKITSVVMSAAHDENHRRLGQNQYYEGLEVTAILETPQSLRREMPPEIEIRVRLPLKSPPTIRSHLLPQWALGVLSKCLSEQRSAAEPNSDLRLAYGLVPDQPLDW